MDSACSMPLNAVQTLLDEANACRERLHSTRRLMWGIENEEVLSGLRRYVEELEKRAIELEQYAAKLSASTNERN